MNKFKKWLIILSSTLLLNACSPQQQILATGIGLGAVAMGSVVASPLHYDRDYYLYRGRHYYGGYYRSGYYYYHGRRFHGGHYYQNRHRHRPYYANHYRRSNHHYTNRRSYNSRSPRSYNRQKKEYTKKRTRRTRSRENTNGGWRR